jgi:hypothetical protein
MKPKGSFLTFVLSWLPGLGHLYLGLNKRGLQFMIGFFACVALIPMLPTVFPFAVAVVWFYSLFDALQKVELVNKYLAGGRGNPGQGQEQNSSHSQNQGDGQSQGQGQGQDTGQPDGQLWEDERPNLAELDAAIYPLQLIGGRNSFDPLWIGTLCVLLGILVLIRRALPMVWDVLMRIHFGSILLALVLIGFGIWLIRTQHAKKS